MLFSIYIFQIEYLSLELECEKNENNQKEAGIDPFLKKRRTSMSKRKCHNILGQQTVGQ